MKGIAISLERLSLEPEPWRVHTRGGIREARYVWRHSVRTIPVLHCGRIVVAKWGASASDGVGLPRTGWTMTSSIEAGSWGSFGAEPCVIPCDFVLCGSVWYPTRVGIRGLVVEHEGTTWAYMEVEPACRYYSAMAHERFQPVLVDQRGYGNYGETS